MSGILPRLFVTHFSQGRVCRQLIVRCSPGFPSSYGERKGLRGEKWDSFRNVFFSDVSIFRRDSFTSESAFFGGKLFLSGKQRLDSSEDKDFFLVLLHV